MKKLSIFTGIWNPKTSLWKVWENLWEFTITSDWDERMVNFENSSFNILKENSFINKKWIKQIIEYIKKSLKEKNPHSKEIYAKIDWVKNPANINFHCYFDEESNRWKWWVWARNDMRKNFRYWPSDYDMMENWAEDPINLYWTLYFSVTEQNLKKYIWDLQEEIWEEREYNEEGNEIKK